MTFGDFLIICFLVVLALLIYNCLTFPN